MLTALHDENKLSVIPFDLVLDYNVWTHTEILAAVMPEDLLDEVPAGYELVGHVAHLNIRDQYLPYKHLIGQVIIDKNSGIRTVINKLDTIGEESLFRTFPYEVVAGENDLNVETREQNCRFDFDFSKVYWNSRLSSEHERIVAKFRPGDAVCDVMAGVGPFAVPAGKKEVFTWANDLNPECYKYLEENIRLNKVPL